MTKSIYVISTFYYISGGTESLHQLAETMSEKYGETYIYYYDNKNVKTVPEKLKNYNVKITNRINDNVENIVIVPETLTWQLYKYTKVKKIIWWLSLDYYLQSVPIYNYQRLQKKYNIPKSLKHLIVFALILRNRHSRKYFKFRSNEKTVFHLYNAQYIKDFLIKNNVKKEMLLYLCGPINQKFFEKSLIADRIKKFNIVLYNPKKGYEFTEMIIKSISLERKDIKFIPLEKMNYDQMITIMLKSKVYVDFGDFPGPERIPRESVLLNCNILTSNLGSASNDIDVPIPFEYKFEKNESRIVDIKRKIYELLDNYNLHYHSYDKYREKVFAQKELFQRNIEIFVDMFTWFLKIYWLNNLDWGFNLWI